MTLCIKVKIYIKISIYIFKGEFVSTNHIFRKGTSTKLRAYATARMKEISQGGESTPSVYPFAMDTNGAFCDTAMGCGP